MCPGRSGRRGRGCARVDDPAARLRPGVRRRGRRPRCGGHDLDGAAVGELDDDRIMALLLLTAPRPGFGGRWRIPAGFLLLLRRGDSSAPLSRRTGVSNALRTATTGKRSSTRPSQGERAGEHALGRVAAQRWGSPRPARRSSPPRSGRSTARPPAHAPRLEEVHHRHRSRRLPASGRTHRQPQVGQVAVEGRRRSRGDRRPLQLHRRNERSEMLTSEKNPLSKAHTPPPRGGHLGHLTLLLRLRGPPSRNDQVRMTMTNE